jgi:phenylpropionate dioxygenase-like ring-hydroxylating dioxygenase large terminal subunit
MVHRDVLQLVENGRVHSDVYTSEEIFRLEIEHIFHRSWLYIGHESEIPNAGDYRLRTMGTQPVIMVRGHDGVVRVLVNRCRHRGATVCQTEQGRVDRFRCAYHGWTYETTGKLAHVTGPEGYGPEFRTEDFGLTPLPHVDQYRSFVFASLAPAAPSLRDHLGLAATMMDFAVDASPVGELLVDGGVYKTVYNGNWKFVGMDGYHPNFTHASVMAARRQKKAVGKRHEEYRYESFDDRSEAVTRDLGNGHATLDMRAFRAARIDEFLDEMRKRPGGDEYVAAMRAAYGEERGDLLVAMAGDPHLGVFPNLQLINDQIRLIRPIAADKTEVLMFAVRLQGVSKAINEARVRSQEFFFGPAGAGSPDDTEMFERLQRGMMAKVEPWVDLSRGLGRERVDVDGSVVGRISDEVPQRAQMKRWRALMAGASADNRAFGGHEVK